MADLITNNLSIVDDAEGAVELWSDESHDPMSIDLDTLIFVEGAGSVADRVAGVDAEGGLGWDYGTNTDLSGQVMYMWSLFADITALKTRVNGGVAMRFTGASDTDYFEVTLEGSDTLSPPEGGSGFKMYVVDVDLAAANPDTISGSPPATTAIHWVGMIYRTTKTIPGSANTVYCDTFSTLAAGTPGLIVEGSNSGPAWTWQDVVDATDLTDPAKAWGTVTTKDGVIFLNTPIQFGIDGNDADVHLFEDVGRVIVWENRLVKDTFYGLSMIGNSGAGTTNLTAGTKVGSGETAVGVNGWTILTGGPKWFIDMESANQDGANFYGCSLADSAELSIDDSSVEIISCVFSNCDQLTVSGGSGGPTLLSNFFSAAPGPLAQIKWGNTTTASDGQFDFNSFVNMKWWAIEFDTAGTYNLRGVKFSGNGTDRDLLASHNSGTVTVEVLEFGDTPGGTNGATITVTTAGASDIRMTAVSLDNVNQGTPVETSSGTAVIDGTDPVTAAVTPDDANNYLAAIYGADVFGTVDWSGSSAYVPQVEGVFIIDSAVTSGANKEGVTGAQTASADHSGTVLNAALSIINVQNEAASPVLEVDPEWRPVETTLASTTHVFGYGVPTDLDTPGTDLGAFIMIHTQDPTAADTVVSSVSWGGTSMVEEQVDFADDSGGGGEGLSTTIFSLVGSNLRKGTFTILSTVPIEVNGVSEGAQCYMEADGITGPLSVGTEILNLAADSSGVAASTFGGQTPQGVIVKARSSGTVGGVLVTNDGDGTLTGSPGIVIDTTLDDWTRDAGDWFADGFLVGQFILVAGSASNNNSTDGFEITALTTTILTTGNDDLTTEGSQTDLVITGRGKTDQTTAARDRATTDDIHLIAAGGDIREYVYIGAIDKFDRVNFDVGTAGTGSYGSIGWEYWNGSIWAFYLFGGPRDTTDSFRNLGCGKFQVDAPSDWVARTVDAQLPEPGGTLGPLFWIRGSVVTGSVTIQPLGNTISVAEGNTVKYLPFETTGTIESGTGLSVTAVWLPDLIAS